MIHMLKESRSEKGKVTRISRCGQSGNTPTFRTTAWESDVRCDECLRLMNQRGSG